MNYPFNNELPSTWGEAFGFRMPSPSQACYQPAGRLMKALIVCPPLVPVRIVDPTEAQCSRAPEFRPGGGLTPLWGRLGSTARLNCTALVPWDPAEEPPCAPPTLQWSKDGRLLTNRTEPPQNTSWCAKTPIINMTLRLEVHPGQAMVLR